MFFLTFVGKKFIKVEFFPTKVRNYLKNKYMYKNDIYL